MNILILPAIILTLTACGQTSNSDNISLKTPTEKDTINVYKKLSISFCKCVTETMRDNKPSTTFDSCYQVVLSQYTDTLKSIGFDPATESGQLKLSQEVTDKLYFNCPDIYALLKKQWADEDAKKLLFRGTIVSQKKLENGEVEIIMLDLKTHQQRIFKGTTFLTDPTKTNKNTLSYEMTVEYEVRKNPKTKQEEYYIKEEALNMTLSIEKKDK